MPEVVFACSAFMMMSHEAAQVWSLFKEYLKARVTYFVVKPPMVFFGTVS